jgi:hypothetical protein
VQSARPPFVSNVLIFYMEEAYIDSIFLQQRILRVTYV